MTSTSESISTLISSGEFNPDVKVDLGYSPKELAEVKKNLASAEKIVMSSFNNYMKKSYIPMINKKFKTLNDNINGRFKVLDSKVNDDFTEIKNNVSESTKPIKEELKETKESFDYANQYLNELKNQGREVNDQINKTNDSVQRKLTILFVLRLLPIVIILFACLIIAGGVIKITYAILAINNGWAEFGVSVVLIILFTFICAGIWKFFDKYAF